MFIRDVFIATLFAIFAYASAASGNSCSNVAAIGTFDESGLQESVYGINATGTFRIQGEEDESKQPLFNLTTIDCENQRDEMGKVVSLECKVTKAVEWPDSGKPDTDNPNCFLDLTSSTYAMKELQKGILTGVETDTGCFNTMLTIDRNTKRVYLSFTRTKYAGQYDQILPGTCGSLLRTQVLMNCTPWPRIRKQGQAPPRFCDFSSSGDK